MRAAVSDHKHWSLGCLAVFLAACSGDGGGINTASIMPAATAVTSGFVPGVPKGYQCPLVPNGFDPVGSIYRLDSCKMRGEVSKSPAMTGFLIGPLPHADLRGDAPGKKTVAALG